MAIRARYAGTCARTGRPYSAGTRIEKYGTGWAIAAGETPIDWRSVQLDPLAAEYGGDGSTEPEIIRANVAGPIYCGCCKSLPGFDPKREETFAPSRFRIESDRLECPHCGRRGMILPPEPVVRHPPEVKRCWECGCEFTYADCKRSGGDWSESYCGC